jgi:hypothetical protein
MQPDLPISVPRSSLEKLLAIPGAAAARVFLILCTEAGHYGLACISASALAARAGVGTRTIFEVLTQLETADCIRRESREPGFHANRIRVIGWLSEDASAPGDTMLPTAPVLQDSGSGPHDEALSIEFLIASCYRTLNTAEVVRVQQFICERFEGDIGRFAQAVTALRQAGGVAAEAPLHLSLSAIEMHA